MSKDESVGTNPYYTELDVFESCGDDENGSCGLGFTPSKENRYQINTHCPNNRNCPDALSLLHSSKKLQCCNPVYGASSSYLDCNINYGWNTMTLIWKKKKVVFKANGDRVDSWDDRKICNSHTPVWGRDVIIPADNGNVSCSGPRKDEVVVYSDSRMHVKASDKIKMLPGFKANKGSYATFRIGDCKSLNFKSGENNDGQKLKKKTKKDTWLINGSFSAPSVVVYPNPAKSSINVKVNGDYIKSAGSKSYFKVKIINVSTGKKILSTAKTNFEFKLDLSGLSSGTYILKVR
ncbi:MAG: T9SS type A sorting domain-containing protein, partial [Flavobacteriales bacterium]